MQILQAKKENIKKIVDYLRKGMVLVCPTDTVYGLVCDAKNEKAVEKIFGIKQREKTKPLAVFVKNIAEAKKIAIINENQKKFLQKN
jgi:L-threonylcarbamoyladenylate synthase